MQDATTPGRVTSDLNIATLGLSRLGEAAPGILPTRRWRAAGTIRARHHSAKTWAAKKRPLAARRSAMTPFLVRRWAWRLTCFEILNLIIGELQPTKPD